MLKVAETDVKIHLLNPTEDSTEVEKFTVLTLYRRQFSKSEMNVKKNNRKICEGGLEFMLGKRFYALLFLSFIIEKC